MTAGTAVSHHGPNPLQKRQQHSHNITAYIRSLGETSVRVSTPQKHNLQMACTIDFRCLDEGFGGKTYNRKRSLGDASPADEHVDTDDMDVEGASQPSKRQAIASSDNPDKPVGRPSYDGVIAGKVSGRKWKQVRTQRASASNVSRKSTTLEQRMKEKEIKKAYQERKKELKEEIRQNKIERRKKREEREKRKQENILRSGTKLQKITNPKTLKKIAKSAKQRRMLKVVSDDVLRGNKKK